MWSSVHLNLECRKSDRAFAPSRSPCEENGTSRSGRRPVAPGLIGPLLERAGSRKSDVFTPHVKYLLTGSDDGTARLWDVDYLTTMEYLAPGWCVISLKTNERSTGSRTMHLPVHNRKEPCGHFSARLNLKSSIQNRKSTTCLLPTSPDTSPARESVYRSSRPWLRA